MNAQFFARVVVVVAIVSAGCARADSPPRMAFVETRDPREIQDVRTKVSPDEAARVGASPAEIWTLDANRVRELEQLRQQGTVSKLLIEPGDVWPLMTPIEAPVLEGQTRETLRLLIGELPPSDFVVARMRDLSMATANFLSTDVDFQLPIPGGPPLRLTNGRQIEAETWQFQVLEVPQGRVTLSQGSTGLRGTAQTNSAVFLVRPLGNGEHVVFKPSRPERPQEPPPRTPPPQAGAAAKPQPCQDAEITVLPLYTDPVEQALSAMRIGDVRDLSSTGRDETNVTMQDAQVNTRVTIRDPQKIAFSHSSQLHGDIRALASRGRTSTDPIAKLRDQWKADVVMLFSTAQDYCGWVDDSALQQTVALPSQAFFVQSIRQDGCTHIFAHEIGHLLGQRHQNDSVSKAERLAYGFCETSQSFATVVVDLTACPAENVHLLWSDPRVKKPNRAGVDVPAGDTIKHYGASVMPTFAKQAAAFRCSSS